ncbi:hypothetical protein [Chromobacterium violaceum]|uniref:hypothetical protein n=1 Tax=Chromobacterium violaceum TaxID=536 RepID=UPI0012D37266|nr:hypothetical protein [Chromobacterium violaceum]
MTIHESVLATLNKWNIDLSDFANIEPGKWNGQEYCKTTKSIQERIKAEKINNIGLYAILFSAEIFESTAKITNKDDELISLKQWLDRSLSFSLKHFLFLPENAANVEKWQPINGKPSDLALVSEEIAEQFSLDLHCSSDDAALGIPFFTKNDNNDFLPLLPNSKLHKAITSLHYLGSDLTLNHIPNWIEKAYFRPYDRSLFLDMMGNNPEDESRLELYFSCLKHKHGEKAGTLTSPERITSMLSDELSVARRESEKYRQEIEELRSEINNTTCTPLPPLVQIAMDIFRIHWHSQLTPQDDVRSRANQEAIVKNLKEKYPGMTDAIAKAIDKVASPIDRDPRNASGKYRLR